MERMGEEVKGWVGGWDVGVHRRLSANGRVFGGKDQRLHSSSGLPVELQEIPGSHSWTRTGKYDGD